MTKKSAEIAKQERAEQLARALRENLRRRKEQARGGNDPEPATPSRHPDEGQDS